MKKIVALGLLVCMVLPVTAYAGQKLDVQGDFKYWPTDKCDKAWWADDNLFQRGCPDVGNWYPGENWQSKDFLGDSTEVYSTTFFGATNPFVPPYEYEYGLYKGRVTFRGTVAGKEGTLDMLFVGTSPGDIAQWTGTWRILSGTKELTNLRGNGEFWSNGLLDIHCEGQIHFDP